MGQSGPYAQMAGHDLNYLSITGALHAMGGVNDVPRPPLNLVGDYGGGSMFLLAGILAALLKAQRTGEGDIIDAAIIDGTHAMMGIVHSLSAFGMWSPKRADNLLDGGMAYYRCYRTSDNKFMAVACIEPQFFAVMLEQLKINPDEFGGQNDPSSRAKQHERLAAIFAGEDRAHWTKIFDGTDACVTPVLDYQEAMSHPQNQARQSHIKSGLFQHPNIAPRFEHAGHDAKLEAIKKGEHTSEILHELGLKPDLIASLLS